MWCVSLFPLKVLIVITMPPACHQSLCSSTTRVRHLRSSREPCKVANIDSTFQLTGPTGSKGFTRAAQLEQSRKSAQDLIEPQNSHFQMSCCFHI